MQKGKGRKDKQNRTGITGQAEQDRLTQKIHENRNYIFAKNDSRQAYKSRKNAKGDSLSTLVRSQVFRLFLLLTTKVFL
jgi:hypothetical protein